MERQSTARWLERLPRPMLAAAAGCFFAGFFAHLFAFTNVIPNADGISRVFDEQQMTISGRWFLHYASAWNGYLQAPALIGFFSLLFLALAAGLTVCLLRIRRVGIAALCGALMSVFPSVAYTFLYLFTASAYCFGILLAVLSVWLVSRYKYGFLFAAPVLACAVGTYQAYLAVAASLSLICVLLFALDGERTGWAIVREGLKYLLFLVAGLGLYAIILVIFLEIKDLKLLDYKGISSLGGMGLRGLLRAVKSAYWNFLRYFFVPHSFANYTTPATVAGNAALALTAFWAFVRLLRRANCRKRKGTLPLILLLCALLPLALNLTVLMGEAMPIMRYALVLSYVLALTLVDRAAAGGMQNAECRMQNELPITSQRSPEDGETPVGAVIGRPQDAAASPACHSERSEESAPPAPACHSERSEESVSPAPACHSERSEESVPPARRLECLLRGAACCASALLLILSFQIDNLAYTVSAQAHRATESFVTRLVERVESAPGYRDGMPVFIVGGFPAEVYYNQIEAFSLVEDYSDRSITVIPMNKHIYYYLNDWLNVPWAEPSERTLQAVSDSPEFQAMPLYPDDGSVAIVNDRVFVKLAEKYTPKKSYEIAYENRK